MPDLGRTWVDEFAMQMTIQQADADEIDQALADVRSHCADSGQSAFEAFGDPKNYAATLAVEVPSAPQRRLDPRRIAMLLPSTWGLAVIQMALWARRDDDVPVSVGQVLLIVVAIPVWVILTAPWMRRRPRDPLRPDRPAFDEKGWRPLWLTCGLAAIAASLWLGLDQTMFTVSKWGLLGSGFVLLASGVSLVWLLAPRRASRR